MKKIIIPISTLFVVGISHAQTTPNLSTSENYVYSKTYLHYPKPSDADQTIKSSETVQYLDGLGRPKQVVNVKVTPQGKDVVIPIIYDSFGRQTRDYLPIPQNATANGQVYTQSTDLVPYPIQDITGFYSGEKIYSEKILENSPLDRIQQQIQVGNDWTTKPVKFDYDANIAGEVIKYTTTTIWENGATKSVLTQSGTYGSSQLYKNTVIDEDLNKTIEFKNGEGQTLLVRKAISDTENADTYYVYNEYNQLVYVIPPNAAFIYKNLSTGTAVAYEDINLNNLCYRYRYDGRNRLVEKKLPGKGWEYMVYDKTDRLIATQDANLKPQNKWLFTKYDKLGRDLYTGIAIDNGDRNAVQNWIDSVYPINTEISGSYTQSGLLIYYANTAYPQNIESILSVNYYDSYLPGDPFPTMVYDQIVLPSDVQQYGVSTKGLPVSSFIKNIEDDNWTKNYFYYDLKGRLIREFSQNHLGGYTNVEKRLDFSGVPNIILTQHKRIATDTEKVITENFTYDHQNRLLTHTHKVDNNPIEYLAQNKYNELSQLESKKVGGVISGSGLQNVDYTYNIRGWMTKINDPANLGSDDLFGYKIKYNQIEGLQTPDATDTALQVLPKYNGNIAEVDWKTSTQENEPLKTYGYVYDSLNRLTAGFYQNETNPSVREYYEKVSYDLNGNIKTMKRTAQRLGATSLLIDNLSYQYENSNASNRLQKISETVTIGQGYPYKATPTDIGYDSNGNITSFADKGISSIQYNFLNLPKQITQNSVITNYIYRADGVKLKKLFGDVETDYLDGFQYKYTYAFEDETGTMQNDEIKLRIIPTSEGYYDALLNLYIYNYVDHLGNVRISYADSDHDGNIRGRDLRVTNCSGGYCNDSFIPGEIVAHNTYYPFGMLFDHNAQTNSSNAYKYKYNGKELQETGMYDYGARFYMPDIGRWLSIDPLTEKMRRFSPYNYAWDNPIRFIDPDGMFATPPDDYLDVNGRYLGSDGAATKNVRVINRTDWNTISSDNGGSLSATATTALQASSSIITINNTQINSDINNANNETIADQTKERQVWVGIDVTRGDIPTAQVTSVRGPDGTDGETVISTTSRSDASGNVVKTNFDGTNLIAASQVHTHNVSQKPDTKTIPGTSPPDANTSKSYKMPIYAVDSYTGSQKSGNRISRVIPNGTTNTAGTTAAHNIGQETLNQFVNKQKYP